MVGNDGCGGLAVVEVASLHDHGYKTKSRAVRPRMKNISRSGSTRSADLIFRFAVLWGMPSKVHETNKQSLLQPAPVLTEGNSRQKEQLR